VRVATLAKKLLGVSRIHVRGVESERDGITIEVRPSWQVPRCGSCRRRAPGYDRQPARRWRHLAVGGVILWLRYAPRRVECRRCGVHAEAVSWAASLETRFTEAFEELVAYLARSTDKTTVSTLLGIAWRSVGAIAERVVQRHLDSKRLDGLVFIPNDEKLLALANDLVHQLNKIFGEHPGFRPAHAKGAMFTGTFTPAAGESSLTKAPHAMRPSTPVTVRFSNSTGIPKGGGNRGVGGSTARTAGRDLSD
jgi:zinc-finger of transposase IS204/IS1001/IS1096/IS1165